MELVIAGDLLHQPRLARLEQDEVAQVVEQQVWGEEASDHLFQLELKQRPVVLAAHRAPGQEALAVGGERAHPRVQAVGDHQRLIADEQVGNLVLVGLQLLEGRPDVGLLVGEVLQLDHRDGQAVDEADEVRAARLLAALHGELVDHQKLVVLRLREVDEAHAVAALASVGRHLHRNALQQRLVEAAVVQQERRLFRSADPAHRFVERRLG